MDDTNRQPIGGPQTLAEALGQIVWLFTQSATHRELPFRVLEATVLPALAVGQARVFRFGKTDAFDASSPEDFAQIGTTKQGLEELPLGFALWAFLSEAAERKLEAGQALADGDWNSGDRAWLVELVSPFANEENQLSQVMVVDLMKGPFKDRPFKLHRTDPMSGHRAVIVVDQHVARKAG